MGIGKTGMNQERDPISVWKVYLPFGVDREKYVKGCYRTGTVTLINENGEIINNVKIGRIAIQLINFPPDQNSFGSEVVCVTVPYSGEIRVVDVYAGKTEFLEQDENQIKLSKSVNGEFAELLIDGKRGRIAISVDSDDTQGEVSISVTNSDRTAKLNVNVNGEILVVNDGKTTLQSSQEIQLEQYDGNEKEEKTFVNIKKDTVLISSAKILLNDGDEPVLLGNKTTDLLKELLDQLSKETAGPYSLTGKAVYSKIAGKLSDLKSKISFLK